VFSYPCLLFEDNMSTRENMLSNHVDNSPSYLPDMDPGRYGGGTYTSQSIEPTIEAYENIFGPSARDIKTDMQRFKRHGRWHLPDILKGPNTYLTDRVDGLITDATNSPFTSKILPYKYMEQPDGKIKWNVWSFDEGLASRVPYESAARTLTQSKKSYSGYMVRQGMAIVLEHNFMMSESGRINFKRQLQQLVGSIQLTNDMDVHVALVLAPSYQKDIREKYIEQEKSTPQICRDFIDLFGFVQKNQNAMDILIEEAKTQLRMWGSPMPSFLMCNSKLTFQLTMTPDVTNYVAHGAEGQKRLKAGPDLPSYRGINIMHTRAFSMEPGAPPRDILRRRVRVAEYYRIKPHPENYQRQFQFYNEERDTWFSLSFKELLHYAKVDVEGSHGMEPGLPGSDNHVKIRNYTKMLTTQMQQKDQVVTTAKPLGYPMKVQSQDSNYSYLHNVYVAILNKYLTPQFEWNPKKVTNSSVFVPGAYSYDVDGTAVMEMRDHDFWNILPKPLQDALVDVTNTNMTWYRLDYIGGNATSIPRNTFELMINSVQDYPRYLSQIPQNLFFSRRGHNSVGFYRFDNFYTLPVCFHIDQYGDHTATGGQDLTPNWVPVTPNDLTFNYQNANSLNFGNLYNFDWLTRVFHFRNYNRYAVGSNLIKPQQFSIQTTYEYALNMNEGYLMSSNNTPDGGLRIYGDSYLRNIGAFFCPNHFRHQYHADDSLGVGNIIGRNMILNYELIYELTKTSNTTGQPCAVDGGNVNIDFNDITWQDRQWEKTFLYDVLRSPGKYRDFLAKIKAILENTYTLIKSADHRMFSKSELTCMLLQSPNIADNFKLLLKSETGRGKVHYMSGLIAKYHHYWFLPSTDNTDNEIFNIPAGVFPQDHTTAYGNGRTTLNHVLLHTRFFENMHLPSDFLSDYSVENMTAKMNPLTTAGFFLSTPVLFPKQCTVKDSDVMDFLHSIAFRLWADQEKPMPSRWSSNPLDYLVPSLDNIGVLSIPEHHPDLLPGVPAGGSQNPKTIPGIENVEIVVIRPNIEHHMLGIIMGQGGESLGSTFWGQTELSCYDDSMHGIWGMSYKYHSRAVVINSKNLVRLWDIAYDGYVGGKDDTYVDWTNDEDVSQFHEHTMDVSKQYRGKSMMVMAFDHSDKKNSVHADLYEREFLPNWPSPIMFFDDYHKKNASLAMDSENIHVCDTNQFRVFNKGIYKNRYRPYKDKMPDFMSLHKIRKNAALAAVENEVSSDAHAFQGTMQILNSSGQPIEQILGSGHHGPDFIGASSLRAGKGYKFNTPQPSMLRIV
jgi:hypothetical protein